MMGYIMTTKHVAGTYVQIFAPIREKDLVIDKLDNLVAQNILPEGDYLTVGASGGFVFRESRVSELAGQIYELSIDAPHRVSLQKKRANKFANKASNFHSIVCLYVPGEMATIELDAFVRACNKPVNVIAFQRSK